jgi:hypothetical protein
MRRTIALLIAIFVTVFVLAPPVLHEVLTPFARSCEPHTSVAPAPGGRVHTTFHYVHCEFGLPAPLEVYVSMLASDSTAPVTVALILVLLVGALCYAIWRGFRMSIAPSR